MLYGIAIEQKTECEQYILEVFHDNDSEGAKERTFTKIWLDFIELRPVVAEIQE
jgi:hypothetical protein